MSIQSAVVASLVLALGAGCATYDRRAGVSNLWRGDSLPAFEDGVTTRSQVLERLGPPSQVIPLDDRVVFYYLRERTRGNVQVFVVYNRQSEDITYDRAIFFFDRSGVLVDHALSQEQIPRD